MNRFLWCTLAGVALSLPAITFAEEIDDTRQAVRADAWVSSDAEGNEAQKLALGWDVAHRDLDHWWGVKLERARFAGEGWSDTQHRVYLSGAGEWDGWLWKGDMGSNGHDLLGRASIHSQDALRKEIFIEREVLETRGGLANDWMQTFAGAAIDVPMGERASTTLLVGLQDFGTGSNLRTHVRANLVGVVAPAQGLSVQLRTRYFQDSDPREADYFSPAWYGEALGVLGWRRFVGGYQWRALAGVGRQRSAGEDWKRARMLQVGVETPRWKDAWLRVDAGYTDTPVLTDSGTGSYAYRYLQVQGVIAF